MRIATVAVCLLVGAGAFVAFGFWRRANTQADTADSAEMQSRQPSEAIPLTNDETARAPGAADNLPPGSSVTAARANNTGRHPSPESQTGISDEGQRLREMLASSDEEARRRALLALGKLDDTDPKLLTDVLAEDPSARIRAAAARGLSRLGRRETIPQLLDALDDEDINVRTWAITALNNTLIGVRFPYNANEPREARLRHIAIIRTRLTAWGVLSEDTGE